MGESVVSDGDSRPGNPPSTCPRPGRYRHHKGAEYLVVDCVRHSETDEWLVLYRALYGERGLWVRPLAMFVDTVEKAGREVPRFAFAGDGGESPDDGASRT